MVQVRRLPGPLLGRTAIGAVSPPVLFRRGRVGKTRGCYPRDRRFDPCRRSFPCPRGRSGDDAGPSTRKLRVRVPPRVLNDRRAPAGRPRGKGSTPVPRGRRRGSRPGSPTSVSIDSTSTCAATTVVIWLWGSWPPHRPWKPGIAGSSPASQTLRGRGAVVLASLMSSRPWVQIPPARLSRGRSSDGQSARLSGERPPVRARPSPLWPWYRGKHSGS